MITKIVLAAMVLGTMAWKSAELVTQSAKAESPMSVFADQLGSWKLSYSMRDEHGILRPQGSGIETYRMTAGGKWLVIEFEGQLMGAKYESIGITGFDPEAEEYVTHFFDPYLQTPTVTRGSWNAEKQTMTKWSDGQDFQGRNCRWRQELDLSKKDTYDLQMYTVYGEDREQHAISCKGKRKP